MQANEHLHTGASLHYQRRMLEIRGAFDAGASGGATIAARAAAIDELIQAIWAEVKGAGTNGIALLATGGYGRRELFPFSDVDLLFLLDAKTAERDVKPVIRKVSQDLWDLGIRIAPTTRKPAECERFDSDVAEFTLALIDHRLVAGSAALYERFATHGLPRLLQREQKAIVSRLVEITRMRHAKYGDTLFHLEPNIKECPGGLRDVHVCGWIERLSLVALKAESAPPPSPEEEFRQAVEFLYRVRCFLHYLHDRDDNTLDWQAQDLAAAAAIGLPRHGADPAPGAAYWMRLYFRNARSVERRVKQMLGSVAAPASVVSRLRSLRLRRPAELPRFGYAVEQGRLFFDSPSVKGDPAHDPDIVLQAFAALSASGASLSPEAEERLADGLPLLSSQLEEGAALWLPLRAILTGHHAGAALRAMHAVGILELILPEFHGIDALVIRDAYHRYTVDEHTFVVIDTLHALEAPATGALAEWSGKLSTMLRDMPHPELLYLGALLHDTGKGRSSGVHASESVRLAAGVLSRLDLDPYENDLVLSLIRNHLEMSAALRRDIFDAETVRAFSAKAGTPEALRMLTLFTFADINAVHPDALTLWKAENIWRLYIATANYLDRSVDDERVSGQVESDLVHRVAALLPRQKEAIRLFLEGFPERYLRTRTPEQVRAHFELSQGFAEDKVQLIFRYALGVSEITLVSLDRPLLFATVAGALAAWGMNIVTADAFSNREGIVIDTFRFTDTFRTLELNATEHNRFIGSVHDVLSGTASLETLLNGRRKLRSKPPMLVVESRIDFDDQASSHSTLVQVVAQDVPGLLRALGVAFAQSGCNIEVALVDTEGEMAIDVFYLTKDAAKLNVGAQTNLRAALLQAITANMVGPDRK